MTHSSLRLSLLVSCFFFTFLSSALFGQIDIDSRLLGLWKYDGSNTYIHFITKTGLVVFSDSDGTTTLGYGVSKSVANEKITFEKADGKDVRIYGFRSIDFLPQSNKIRVKLVKNTSNQPKEYTLTRQSESSSIYAKSSVFNWHSEKWNLSHPLKGTWASTSSILSIYDDGLWLTVYPQGEEARFGGFLAYDADSSYPLKMYYHDKSKSDKRIVFNSQHQIKLIDDDGNIKTFYRRSWKPGETVKLAPSAVGLLSAFFKAFLSDDNSNVDTEEWHRQKRIRDAGKAKQDALDSRRYDGGY